METVSSINKPHTTADMMLLLRKILYSFESKETESLSQSGVTREQRGNETDLENALQRLLVSVSAGGEFSIKMIKT